MTPHDGTAPAGSRRPGVRDREEAVVERLGQLAAELDADPDPRFREATRARLVAMAAVRAPEPAPRSPLRRLMAARASDLHRSPWRTRLTAGLAGAALAVTTLGTLVAVATDAGPGDALYGLKRGTEQTQLALAGNDRGATLLEFAGTRLHELEELLGAAPAAAPAAETPAPDVPAALVVQTLGTMDQQTAEGAYLLTTRATERQDPEAVDELAGWAAEQSTGLSALGPSIPEEARPAVRSSLVLLEALTARASDLRAALACPGGPTVEGSDRLGPVPVLCAPTQPPPPAAADDEGGGPAGGIPSPSGGSTAAPPTDGAPPVASPPEVPAGGGSPTAGTGAGGADGGSGTGGSVPTPTVPVPPPGGGLPPAQPPTAPEAPRPAPQEPPPPVLDTPLPICIPLVIC
ncbi:MAG TPA: DUF5667 domain-containing protein [Geodermatophilus sp.]|nr:DUF5667 domain-containing protein [Geodermatophilus sp.]